MLVSRDRGAGTKHLYYQVNQLSQPENSATLCAEIVALYHRHKGSYGYRCITLALRRSDWLVSHKRVQRLMQQMRLISIVRPKNYRSYKGQKGRIAPNNIQRQFEAKRPNEKWVTDVTGFNVAGEKLYLSPKPFFKNRSTFFTGISGLFDSSPQIKNNYLNRAH